MRTITNIFGAVLMAVGLLGLIAFLFGFSGPVAAVASGGQIPMMHLQTQGMLVSATMLICGVVIWCNGTRRS